MSLANAQELSVSCICSVFLPVSWTVFVIFISIWSMNVNVYHYHADDGQIFLSSWCYYYILTIILGINSCSSVLSSTHKRSPRRSKSRWEPLPEEKPVDNPVSISNDTVKYSAWVPNVKDRKVFIGLVRDFEGSIWCYFCFIILINC